MDEQGNLRYSVVGELQMVQSYQITFKDPESTTVLAIKGRNPRNVIAGFFLSEIGRGKAAANQIRPVILSLVPEVLETPFTLAQGSWELQIRL